MVFTHGDNSNAEAVDYGAVRNVLDALAGRHVRIALRTTSSSSPLEAPNRTTSARCSPYSRRHAPAIDENTCSLERERNGAAVAVVVGGALPALFPGAPVPVGRRI
ncbi:hypothetical protein M4I32_14785 [Microbacterium sp. LRZ72]|uniref:hypothetical protein n=1 Tax=Microbacterium sp. LRZ72 TaxID=2942481 RepID=UPI0029B1B30B|nr:hypothetical protein [Microbacterium sp. LRZ72]MDX2378056.1 hypothetical protein [Microbacterium sp. LRZ72]